MTRKSTMLCGSYFEMVKKLDASNVNDLSTMEGFTRAMSTDNQTQVEEFCKRFPGFIPKEDPKQYPQSYKLFTYVNKSCEKFCTDDTDIDKIVILPICRVFAIGFQLSDTKVVAQQGINRGNATISHKQVETNQNSESLQPVVPLKLESPSDNVKGQEIPLGQAPNNVNDAEKNEVYETVPKENSSPNAEPAAEVVQKVGIISTSDNKGPTVVTEVKPIEKSLSPSVNLTNNVKPAEKPVIDLQQSPLEPNPAIDEEFIEEDDDKVNLKNGGVTDFNDNFDDSKDKLGNMNGDDSSEDEVNKNNDEDEIVSNVEQAKSAPDQSPSKEQLQNEDPFTDDTDSNFFTYFMFLLLVCVIGYVVYHNKTKMLALMLEGRRSSTNGRSGLSRRKHTAAYRKLDSNLEEAITSSANGRSTQVIY